MGDLQVSPISQLLHTLGITREDLNKRSDQMRQFLTADDAVSSRVSERDSTYRSRSGSNMHSTSRSVGSSRSFARSSSRASSISVRDGTPPATPVKSEPFEGEIEIPPPRRTDSMEAVLARQRRQRKSRRERERESSKTVAHAPSPSPSTASHSGHSFDSQSQPRDDVQLLATSSSGLSTALSENVDPAPPVTPQKSRYYRDHTNLSLDSLSRKDTALKTETPTPTRASAPQLSQSLPQPQYYAYPNYLGYAHFMPMAYRPAPATSSSFPITPQSQRIQPPHKASPSPLPPSSPPPALSPMSSPTRRINLVSSPGPMGPAPEETEYDNLPYKLPPGPYSPNKPDLSYAALVGRAILSSPDHRLTLQEIYDWITIVYPHYKRGETTWMNSIRHVLSTTVCFRKVPRDRSVGRTLWAIYDEDLECFKDGGFKKHLCKDYVNGNDGKDKQSSSSKGKSRTRKRTDDDDIGESRKPKKARKDHSFSSAKASTFESTAGPSFMASNSLVSHPLFPPTRPTAHHQPYYQSCVPQAQGFPSEVIFPPLPAAAAFNRVVNNLNNNSNALSSTTIMKIKDIPDAELSPPQNSSSPILSASSISSSLSSSVPELTPNLSSSSPPSSLPATSDIDVDGLDSRPTSVKPELLQIGGSSANNTQDLTDADILAEGHGDDFFNTSLLGPVKSWNQSPSTSGFLQPGIELLDYHQDSDDDSSVSLRDKKGKKKQARRTSKIPNYPHMPSSPTLNRARHIFTSSSDVGRPSTPPPSGMPLTPPRSSRQGHQISSTRTPLSHKGLHMSPSASLVHYKSNLDPPPVYSGCIPTLDNPQAAEEDDPMRTPRKRGANASASTSFGHPVTPRKLIFSANLGDSPFRTPGGNSSMSPFRTPGSRSIFDPHDPRILLDEELSAMHYNYDSPGGLYGKSHGSLLYDSPGLDTPTKWW